MENEFFSKPILNSPYEHPSRHWELDNKGQPTHQIIQERRRAEFITPIPKPKKRKGSGEQLQLFDFEEDDPISSADQRYDPTPIINELRKNVDDWRKLPNLNDMVVDENDELIDTLAEAKGDYAEERDFVQMILENLKTAGVQQAHKVDKINFTSLTPWPGDLICAEGGFRQDEQDLQDENKGTQSPASFPVNPVEKRAAIFIGPEFGTVSRPDLVAAAREAGDAGFDVLIACAFNYDAHSSEFDKLGRILVLKARMNADLHMADDLKNTGKGNLFIIFGEPDIDILETEDGKVQVKINGVDVFHPNTGEVRSDGAEGIACWFIDTDYNEESFFVRHAYFLGANDLYKALKTTLKAEINEEAWASLNSDTSRHFDKPKSGRIAVKVINHLGDEVMKVFKVA
jgi:adenine-specific DNA-methyltransferase